MKTVYIYHNLHICVFIQFVYCKPGQSIIADHYCTFTVLLSTPMGVDYVVIGFDMEVQPLVTHNAA